MPENKNLAPKEQYAKMVCLFLAEGLRTRRIAIKRAHEIAEKVLVHINLLDAESDFLALIRELAHDFEELETLEGKLLKQQALSKRRELELKVTEYATTILSSDPQQAFAILEDAASDQATLDSLRGKYPDFN